MTSRAPFQGPRNTVRSENLIQYCCHKDPILSKKQKNKKRILKNDADLGKQETRANVERTDYFAPTTEIISV